MNMTNFITVKVKVPACFQLWLQNSSLLRSSGLQDIYLFMFDSWQELCFTAADTCRSKPIHIYKENKYVNL